MWTVRLEFAYQWKDENWEIFDDLVEVSKSFSDEEEAKIYWREAAEAVGDWLDDEKGVRPGPKAVAFVQKYNITIFDPDGVPYGGYINGDPVGDYQIAPYYVLQAVKTESVLERWAKEDDDRLKTIH